MKVNKHFPSDRTAAPLALYLQMLTIKPHLLGLISSTFFPNAARYYFTHLIKWKSWTVC